METHNTAAGGRQIHRTDLGSETCQAIKGPSGLVTFGCQEARKTFSIWHHSDAPMSEVYLVVPTGHDVPDNYELVATTIVQGFYTFHLLRFVGSETMKEALLRAL